MSYSNAQDGFQIDPPEDEEDSGWGAAPSDEGDYIVKGDDLLDFGTSLSTFDED